MVGFLIALTLTGLSFSEQQHATPPVILISADGMADWIVDEFRATGVLSNYGVVGRLFQAGAWAESMRSVPNPVTGPAHATLYTGALPSRHGIVGNVFHALGDRVEESANVTQPLVETMWEAVMRQGKRTVLIGGPFVDTTARGRGNLTLAPAAALGGPRVVGLIPGSPIAAPTSAVEQAVSLAPDTGAELEISFRLDETGDVSVPVHAFAVDTRTDGTKRFNGVWLALGAEGRFVGPGSWFPVPVADGERTIGLWAKLLELDPITGAASLYLGPLGFADGWPRSFVREIDDHLGFWPGNPDFGGVISGRIDPITFVEQAERASAYLIAAAEHVIEHEDFDLLQVYVPLVDNVGHAFLVRDPRQRLFGDDRGVAAYEALMERAYTRIDEGIGRLVDTAGDWANVVITSDHGMTPVHTQVVAHSVLADAGFRTRGDTIDVRAFGAPGGVAQVYLNLRGREEDGSLAPADFAESLNRVRVAFDELSDPVTGESVVSRTLDRSELEVLGLAHPAHTGDLWVELNRGYMMNTQFFSGSALSPAPLSGTHGHAVATRDMSGVFFAIGPQVRPRPLGPVRITQVAPTIARLLGVEPPAAAFDTPLELERMPGDGN